MAVRQLEQSEIRIGCRIMRLEGEGGAKGAPRSVAVALARLNGAREVVRRRKLRVCCDRELNRPCRRGKILMEKLRGRGVVLRGAAIWKIATQRSGNSVKV